jgi:hypothetical protein
MTEGTRYRLISFALAVAGILVFLALLFAANSCVAQSTQYQIERVCIDNKCNHCTGYIAIYKENLYIKVDSVLNHLLVERKFKHKNAENYWLKEHRGRFQICDNIAYLEIYFTGCGWKSETYYLKE